MGQVAIDLPDPLNNSGPSGPGVDDLLAQLAGEEIDRLLAEAEIERPAKAVEVIVEPADVRIEETPVAEAKAEKTGQAPGREDPEKLSGESEAVLPSAAITEAGVEELDARVAQELSSLFTELDSEKPGAAAATAPAPVPAVRAAETEMDVSLEQLAAMVAPVPSDPVEQAQALEKQLLGKALMDALGGPEMVESAPSRMKAVGLSLLFRPLEWVNAPLGACSDAMREGLGKVAIMTLINALAILLYVLFLRKH